MSGTEIGVGIVLGREEAHCRSLLGWRTGPAGREAGWMGLGLKGSCLKLCFTSTTAHLHEAISPRGGRVGRKQIFQHRQCQAGAALSGPELLQK